MTPANNPQTFQSTQFANIMLNDRRTGLPLPGTGFRGMDLMSRILMALKSGIQEEEDWAVSALMQVSYNQPKACNLRVQANLADVLLRRISVACVSEDESTTKSIDEPTLTGRTVKEQQKILDALLVLRNASFDPENAQFLARSELCRNILVHGINLPALRVYTEFKQMCLEIVEAISFHIKFETAEDALLQAVVGTFLASSDRSIIVPSLRSLARFLIRDDQNAAHALPRSVIIQVLRYLLIDDDEIITASLDFLYQYTALPANVHTVLAASPALTAHLVRLLTFGMQLPEPEYIRRPRLAPKPVPAAPPPIPQPILDELLALTEPERATQWIRSSYETEPAGEVTQISLWKAYEAQFETHARVAGGVRLLPAVDFIKNVTAAVQNSAAMVVNLADGQKKFIIKGIVPREVAVSPTRLAESEAAAAATQAKAQASSSAAALESSSSQTPAAPAFGVTVALVLQNIAQSGDGKKLLMSATRALMDAALLNPGVQEYVQDLLELVQEAPVDNSDGDVSDEDERRTAA